MDHDQPPPLQSDGFYQTAQAILDQYVLTQGLGYSITVPLIPGAPTNDPTQTDTVPGWLHGLITHLAAVEESTNASRNLPNPYTLRLQLDEHHGLNVPIQTVLAIVLEYNQQPLDVRDGWRRAVIPPPPMHLVAPRWRTMQSHDVAVDPRSLMEPRRLMWSQMVNDAQLVLPPSQNQEQPPTRLTRPLQQDQTRDESSADPTTLTRRTSTRLRSLGQRVANSLTPQRRQRANTATATPAPTDDSQRRSASPDPDHQPPTRQRSPLLERSNTVTGTGLTRRVSNRVRNLGNSLRGRRDDTTPNTARRSRSPSHDQTSRPQDRDRDIADILADVGLNTRHHQPGPGLLLEDRNMRVYTRRTPAGLSINDPNDVNLFSDDSDAGLRIPVQDRTQPTTGDDWLNLRGQPTLSIDDFDLDQVTNPLAAPWSSTPAPPQTPQTSGSTSPGLATPGSRRSSRYRLPSTRARDDAQTDRQVNLTPSPLAQGSTSSVPRRTQSTTSVPPTRSTRSTTQPQNQPARRTIPVVQRQPASVAGPVHPRGARAQPHVGPNNIVLPTVNTLPGRPVTLLPSATPQQIAYFRSIWQPGQHVPEVIPGCVHTCPVQGCRMQSEQKRQLTRHLRTVHGMTADINMMNQRLPVPARRLSARRYVLLDAQGNDIDDNADRSGGDDSDGDDSDGA